MPAQDPHAEATNPAEMSIGELLSKLDHCNQQEAARIRRLMARSRGRKLSARDQDKARDWFSRGLAKVEARRQSHRAISYPDGLPVSERVDDIAAALAEHQVIIVAGETGSGKTTQIPKICLNHGRGTRGLIGHTQPRRLAARSVAGRIAASATSGSAGRARARAAPRRSARTRARRRVVRFGSGASCGGPRETAPCSRSRT